MFRPLAVDPAYRLTRRAARRVRGGLRRGFALLRRFAIVETFLGDRRGVARLVVARLLTLLVATALRRTFLVGRRVVDFRFVVLRLVDFRVVFRFFRGLTSRISLNPVILQSLSALCEFYLPSIPPN